MYSLNNLQYKISEDKYGRVKIFIPVCKLSVRLNVALDKLYACKQ